MPKTDHSIIVVWINMCL